ncbi:MAG: redoxin domain-containing protein [Merismopedia sp. SIO2A8]|nr:redoxin domain-containing protein [Merismopedia sp. SIO2A8]
MLTSTDFSGLINQRFFNNFFPVPATSHVKVGDRAPQFELPDIRNDTVFNLKQVIDSLGATDDATPPRKLLLAFTRIFTEKQYCPLCFPHIQSLNAAHETLQQQGIDVAMITSTDTAQSKIVVQDLMLNMPLLSDPDCHVFRQYRVGQALGAPLPAQFLVEATGIVQFRHLFSFFEPNASVEQVLAFAEESV